MKKLIWTLVILVVVGVFGGRAWWLYQHRETDTNVVKIGVLLPLSGPPARDGQDCLTGIKAAEKNINANPNNPFKIKLQIEDTKYTESGSLSAYNRTSDCDAYLIMGEVPVKTLSPRIEEDKKPVISLVVINDTPTITNPYIFRGWFSLDKLAQTLAQKVKKVAKDKEVALFKIKTFEGDHITKLLTKELEKENIQPSIIETFPMMATETRSQVAKIMNKKPKVVVVWGYIQGFYAALNSLLEARYDGMIIGTVDLPINYAQVANNAAGIYFTTLEHSFDKIPEFEKGQKPNLYTAFSYEGLQLLAQAIRTHGGKPEQIRQGLLNIKDFETVFGPVSYQPNGEMVLPDFSLGLMKADGTYDILEERE